MTRREFLLSQAVLASAPLLLGGAAEPPLLEVVHPVGLDFMHRNSPTSQKYLIETMGGGVALLDYNNDGLLDIFCVNSGHLDDPVKLPADYRRKEPLYWNRLYRQNRNGIFSDVTREAGVSGAGVNTYGMGVATGDYDNDGHTDLYVTGYPRNILYHNNGDGTFTDVTERAGVAGGGWSASAGFFDYDNDGKLDLFVTRYLDWDIAHNVLCGSTFRMYCRPDVYPPVANVLFHNNGDGTFTDVSDKSGIAAVKGKSLGLAFNDYDGDGRPDVFVANDRVENFLWHNNGNGTFTNRAIDAGVALSDDGRADSGMGVAFSDYDNDGRPDVLVTNLASEIYGLYRNSGGGLFDYASLTTNLGALTAPSSGWGAGLVDFDNDGWKDLFVAQGHVMDNIERLDPGLHYKEVPLLARNVAGKFSRVPTVGIAPVAARGAAFGDLDRDGFMDAVMLTLGGPLVVFRGVPNRNHWLAIDLVGTHSNRDGFGARVEVNGQCAYASSTGSYLSANDQRLHFGLAEAAEARVEIRWPSGAHQTLEHVESDRVIQVREP